MITYLSGWVPEQCGAAFPVPQAAWQSTGVTRQVPCPNILHMIAYLSGWAPEECGAAFPVPQTA